MQTENREYYTGAPTFVPEETTSRCVEAPIHFSLRDSADQIKIKNRVVIISNLHSQKIS